MPTRRDVLRGAGAAGLAGLPARGAGPDPYRRETIKLPGDEANLTVELLSLEVVRESPSVVLVLGRAPESSQVPTWAAALMADSRATLAWVEAEFPPDPDVARRPVWLHFDSRFAHMYAQIVERTPGVIARVLDALITRREFRSARFGMMGVSTTGIATLAAACREPRMESAVAFVATGAVSAWLETWKPNGLWKGRPDEPFWPETLAILEQHDPVRHAAGLKGKRVLLVSGALDNVVDPAAQRVFFEAAREHLAPERLEDLRYVVYEGFAHNLPADAIELEAGPWFRKTLALAGQPRSKPGVSRST